MVSISTGVVLSVALGEPAPARRVMDYERLNFIEVGEVGQIPEFGGRSSVKEFVPLGQRTAAKYPGAANYGSTTISVAWTSNDAGQSMLRSGFDGTTATLTHTFKLEHPDIGRIYFAGVISSFRYLPGDANTIRRLSIEIHLIGKPVVANFFDLVDITGAELMSDLGQLVVWE